MSHTRCWVQCQDWLCTLLNVFIFQFQNLLLFYFIFKQWNICYQNYFTGPITLNLLKKRIQFYIQIKIRFCTVIDTSKVCCNSYLFSLWNQDKVDVLLQKQFLIVISPILHIIILSWCIISSVFLYEGVNHVTGWPPLIMFPFTRVRDYFYKLMHLTCSSHLRG